MRALVGVLALFALIPMIQPVSGGVDFTFTLTSSSDLLLTPVNVTYTYTISNIGEKEFVIGLFPVGFFCSPVVFTGGNVNNDEFVNPGETYTWTCETLASESINARAFAEIISCTQIGKIGRASCRERV